MALFVKLQEGRKRYQKERSRKLQELVDEFYKTGIQEIGDLSVRERFIAGVALYWAEGFKHKDESRLGFATMDSKMAMFYIRWLEECLGVNRSKLVFRVTANLYFVDKIRSMEEYWQKSLGVNRDQFTRPFYQRSKQKRDYRDRQGEYHGVIRIHVRESKNLLRRMRGWMASLAME